MSLKSLMPQDSAVRSHTKPGTANIGDRQIMRIALTIAMVAAAVFAAAATAGQPNPFKCSLGNPRSCGQQAAEKAAANTAKRRLPATEYDVNMMCDPVGARMRVWHCTWGSSKTGAATVTFKATSSGWHTYVTQLRAT